MSMPSTTAVKMFSKLTLPDMLLISKKLLQTFCLRMTAIASVNGNVCGKQCRYCLSCIMNRLLSSIQVDLFPENVVRS